MSPTPTLPPNAAAQETAYEQAILDSIAQGDVQVSWATIKSEIQGHSGKFWITAVPLKVAGVYPGMGARVLQRAGDLLKATLFTPKLLDLAYIQAATRIEPVTSGLTQSMLDACNPQGFDGPNAPKMESLRCFTTYTKTLDELLAKAGYAAGTVAQSVGKPFVLRKGISETTGCNYGWHLKGSGPPYSVTLPAEQPFPFHVIQDPGFAHGVNQNDYASTGELVSRYCEIDGKPDDIARVYMDPVLAPLVNDQGALPFWRQPGVDVYACEAKLAAYAINGQPACPPPTRPPSDEGAAAGSSSSPVLRNLLYAAGAGLAAYGAYRGYVYAKKRRWI